MKIDFAPVSSFSFVENAASLLEVLALARSFSISDDISTDLDSLVHEIQANPEAFGLNLDEIEFLKEEPFAARELASHKFTLLIQRELETRAETFGNGYPFLPQSAAGVVSVELKECDLIHPAAIAAIWIRFFALLQDRDFAQIDKDDLSSFNSAFEDLFEVISVYSASGRVEGAAWWAGRSRGHNKFLGQLNFLRDFLKSGLVRTAKQLQANQVGVNDGGVDGALGTARTVRLDCRCDSFGDGSHSRACVPKAQKKL